MTEKSVEGTCWNINELPQEIGYQTIKDIDLQPFFLENEDTAKQSDVMKQYEIVTVMKM